MEKIKLCFNKHKYFFSALIYASLLLLILGNPFGGLILFGDFNFSLFIKKEWNDILYVWGNNNGGSYNWLFITAFFFNTLFYIVRDFVNNINLMSFLYIFLVYFGLAFSSFLLSNIILERNNFFLSLLIGVFAISNPLIFSLSGQIDIMYSLLFINISIIVLLRKFLKKSLGFKSDFFFILFISLANVYLQNIMLFFPCLFLLIILNFNFRIYKIKKLFLFSLFLYILWNFL